MLRKEDFMVIQTLTQRGLYFCDIAKQAGARRSPVTAAPSRAGGRFGVGGLTCVPHSMWQPSWLHGGIR